MDFGDASENGVSQEVELGVWVRGELLLPRLGLRLMVDLHFNFRIGGLVLFLPSCLGVRGRSDTHFQDRLSERDEGVL
jgi:hypothetical protein